MANVRRLARNTNVDISVDGTTWLNLPARTDSAPQITPNKIDSSDYDNGGYASAEITQQAGSLVAKYNSLINGGTPNAAQQLVEACVGQFGDSARLYVRWYDTDGGTRGFTARAIVEVQYSKTAVTDLREVTVTFTLDGEITAMTSAQISAAIGSSAGPVITSAKQTGTGAGSQVTLTGANFTGASSVKFGATAATQYTVVSDAAIVAVVPASTTGAQAITVTTTNGTSAAYTLTVN